MKLKYNFETLEIDGEICAVPVGKNSKEFNGVLQLNEVGAKIFNCIKTSETKEEALQKLKAEYPDDSLEEVSRNLNDFINDLIVEGVLIP